ncbi:MAG: 16S rRNA (adenine(1518)-N(6)/adenine(1519)-N(6))-dimethyltransferase RsmA [Candidatus Nezhaarchaeota archaeon]|nr:16S rRNA (adenine(1518)-N(6)/adenine(1519)-N(6))-dimethyltransferase RsmA [Candidatus Nezhaarchaeota archaeon]
MEAWRSRKELLNYVKSTLLRYGVRPRRKLGQSFTIDPLLIRNMVDYAEVGPSDEVLEVGGGVGCLTKALALKARRVITVEVDPRLAMVLRELAYELNNIEVIEGDFLDLEGMSVDKVVSTAPYSIASPLILKLVKDFRFKIAILTFQLEFAERLVAEPGSANYGRLTVATRAYADIKLLRCVSRRSFYPTPSVDSAIVEVRPRRGDFKVDDRFLKLIERLFSQRNKLALSVIKRISPEVELDRLSDLINKRVRDLSLEDLHRIYLCLR